MPTQKDQNIPYRHQLSPPPTIDYCRQPLSTVITCHGQWYFWKYIQYFRECQCQPNIKFVRLLGIQFCILNTPKRHT